MEELVYTVWMDGGGARHGGPTVVQMTGCLPSDFFLSLSIGHPLVARRSGRGGLVAVAKGGSGEHKDAGSTTGTNDTRRTYESRWESVGAWGGDGGGSGVILVVDEECLEPPVRA
uniref:Uncharacterized protein n=1 Tax=Oryza sativa subsp. japonica TaxID=39947 RepID=Q7F243_ORYSJ|nr:hypothetical protein [Oryza sativa Japonica Group]BAD30145.1 hypothetical protein [Oryza sativa Japonica Group]